MGNEIIAETRDIKKCTAKKKRKRDEENKKREGTSSSNQAASSNLVAEDDSDDDEDDLNLICRELVMTFGCEIDEVNLMCFVCDGDECDSKIIFSDTHLSVQGASKMSSSDDKEYI